MSNKSRLPSVSLHLAEAQSCITVARTLLAEKLPENQKKIEELMVRAENKIDAACAVLNNLRSRLDDVGKQL